MNAKELKAKLTEQVEKTRDEINILKTHLQDQSKKLLEEGSKFLFDNYPELQKFSWTQYTPYFNDGEQCTFRAGNEYPEVNDEGEELYSSDKRSFAKPLKEFLSIFDDETLEILFGNDVRVTVDRNTGVSTEDFDNHD